MYIDLISHNLKDQTVESFCLTSFEVALSDVFNSDDKDCLNRLSSMLNLNRKVSSFKELTRLLDSRSQTDSLRELIITCCYSNIDLLYKNKCIDMFDLNIDDFIKTVESCERAIYAHLNEVLSNCLFSTVNKRIIELPNNDDLRESIKKQVLLITNSFSSIELSSSLCFVFDIKQKIDSLFINEKLA